MIGCFVEQTSLRRIDYVRRVLGGGDVLTRAEGTAAGMSDLRSLGLGERSVGDRGGGRGLGTRGSGREVRRGLEVSRREYGGRGGGTIKEKTKRSGPAVATKFVHWTVYGNYRNMMRIGDFYIRTLS